jgi:hypothetical protein
MNAALSAMRAPYLSYSVEVTRPSRVKVRDAVVYEPIAAAYTYLLKRAATDWQATLTLEDGSSVIVPVTADADSVDIDGSVRLFWDPWTPVVGEQIEVRVVGTQALQDPEVLLHRLSTPLPRTADEPLAFAPPLLTQMAAHLPDVAEAIGDFTTWGDLDGETQALVRRRFHDFLLVRGNSTRIAVDTNSVVLDLEVGKTPALETFKRLHRYIDVLKELEERLHRRLENVRRMQRLHAGLLADPDIDRVTVVTGAASASGLVSIDADPEA